VRAQAGDVVARFGNALPKRNDSAGRPDYCATKRQRTRSLPVSPAPPLRSMACSPLWLRQPPLSAMLNGWMSRSALKSYWRFCGPFGSLLPGLSVTMVSLIGSRLSGSGQHVHGYRPRYTSMTR
jgi:hypothetical protein